MGQAAGVHVGANFGELALQRVLGGAQFVERAAHGGRRFRERALGAELQDCSRAARSLSLHKRSGKSSD